MPGITAYGAYLPRRRLQRSAIAGANTWFDASLRGLARGERTMCSWDEDTVTMAVEAARDMAPAAPVQALFLASTTHPFAVRQNAGIVAEALNLGSDLRTMDVAGSLRASTTALMSALDAAAAGGQAIVAAADRRKARAGSPMEMLSGDGAAALQVGAQGEVATLLASATVAADFIDHFRASGDAYDYAWEDRWIRDEGWLKLVPQAVARALAKAGVEPADVDRLIVPCHLRRVPETVGRASGIPVEAVADPMMSTVGQCGTAQPLLMLAAELASAEPGQTLVVTGFGQGCDALVFRVTDAIGAFRPKRGVAGWLERRVEETNYSKFLTYCGVVEREYGKRAELDRSPALTAQYRNREGVTGFVGGRCARCGTVQYPKAIYCVNPNCGARDTQEPHPMADVPATVKTFTADHLVFSMDPPAYLGLVEFEGGGRTMVEFTEVEPESFDVGTRASMRFRIKHVDERRGMRQYFWKAAPD
ncbi:MAG: zinc ribbon domain-containing protein [Rhodospirillaceae bacterium]|nr:zinc ribbon domain-containing protein [Rhodospirillaceae bacterium]